MPIIKSAKKAARQSVKRRTKNQEIKKNIRNALKEFRKNPNAETMAKIQSEYDKAAKKGLIKKNTASRRKAKVASFAKASGLKIASGTKATKAAEKKIATKKTTTAKKTSEKAPAKKTTATKKSATKKAEK